MASSPKIVLQLPMSDPALLPGFVERCIAESVCLIAVVGDGCEAIEDEIGWLIVGDGTQDGRFIATTSHPGEALADAVEFATIYGGLKHETPVVVRL